MCLYVGKIVLLCVVFDMILIGVGVGGVLVFVECYLIFVYVVLYVGFVYFVWFGINVLCCVFKFGYDMFDVCGDVVVLLL